MTDPHWLITLGAAVLAVGLVDVLTDLRVGPEHRWPVSPRTEDALFWRSRPPGRRRPPPPARKTRRPAPVPTLR
ncbi:MAG: hypothetical protein HYZ75_09330 [Elusimicrobia bacterium]|nr:hypothetical protein [Elusimicrobiota bacterium]